MKRFLRTLALFFLIQLLVWIPALCVYVWKRPVQESYMAASRDKHRLLEEQPSPRIIFIGGSNVAFGVDSEAIGKQLGRNPVNMGLHGSLGLEFMLNEVVASLRAGDVVVVSPEYEIFRESYSSGSGSRLFLVLEARTENIKYIGLSNVRPLLDDGYFIMGGILDNVADYLKGAPGAGSVNDPTSIYKRKGFNRYGDFVEHRGKPSKAENLCPRCSEIMTGGTGRILLLLNRFNEECKRKGAKLFYSYPAVPDEFLESHEQRIMEIADRVRGGLSFPVIDTPREMAYPLDNFYDTSYHLTFAGTERRAAHLVERLKEQGANVPQQ